MRRRWETASVVASVQAVGKSIARCGDPDEFGQGEVRIVRDFTGRRDARYLRVPRRNVSQSAMPPSQSRRSVAGPMPFKCTKVEFSIGSRDAL